MKKRVLSFFLCLIVCAEFLMPGTAFRFPVVFAEDYSEALFPSSDVISISTADDLIRFSVNCTLDSYSIGKTFSLTANIDISNSDFQPVAYFAGTFLGNGHSITGLEIAGDGSRLGLFRQTTETATIRDLHVRGDVTPGGTGIFIGGICGENHGIISGCSFTGSVSGIKNVGGIAGASYHKAGIASCTFSGTVLGEHSVGGIAGLNEGGITSCTNEGKINTISIVPKTEPSFDLSTVRENDFLDITDIGGICGSSSGAITSCVNRGDIGYLYSGYNVGGICGKSSGFISRCSSSASVNGRRDTGGIVGQLIPYMEWDFSDGKLDDLQGDLNSLSAALGGVSSSVSGAVGGLSWEIGKMNLYISQAVDEIKKLIENFVEDSQLDVSQITLDPTTGQIDITGVDLTLGDTKKLCELFTNMYAESIIITQAAASAAGSIAASVSGAIGQMNSVFNSMFSAVEGLTSVVAEHTDLSVTEALTRDTGAVADCISRGTIKAENNVGGIVGTIGFEVEFDMEDTLQVSSYLSSNARQITFAAIRNCTGCCTESVKENCAGCICGNMDIGIIINSTGVGAVRSQSGDYLGGIVGNCAGTVSGCWARAALSGIKYIGGIAGFGKDINGCRSCDIIEEAHEYVGAVAGWTEGTVENNLYVTGKYAGIDGVSYSGKTDPVSFDEMVSLADVPKEFTDIKVTFLVDGKPVSVRKVEFGDGITDLPQVPMKGTMYWKWDDFDSENIYYSIDVAGQYILPLSTLSSGEKIPAFLAEGTFYEGQKLTIRPASVSQPEIPAEDLISSGSLSVNDYSDNLTIRMRTPDEGILFTCSAEASAAADGTGYMETSYTRDGSYIVFRLENGGAYAYTVLHETVSKRTLVFGALASALVLILLISALSSRKRKKKHHTAK